MTPARLTLIGVLVNSSGTVDGVARAPAVLRQRGLPTALARHRGFTDAGDLVLPVPVPVRGPSGLLAEDALAAMIELVAQAVGAARRPPLASPTGEAADCELGLALGLFDTGLGPRLRAVLPRLDPADVAAVGPRDSAELAAAGVASLDGRLGALIRPAELTADRYAAALSGLPPPWWLHTDLDVLATDQFAAVDYPQPGGLTWDQLAGLTATALAAGGCAGWSVCIYNPDLDPRRDSADAIVSYITQTITTSDQPAR